MSIRSISMSEPFTHTIPMEITVDSSSGGKSKEAKKKKENSAQRGIFRKRFHMTRHIVADSVSLGGRRKKKNKNQIEAGRPLSKKETAAAQKEARATPSWGGPVQKSLVKDDTTLKNERSRRVDVDDEVEKLVQRHKRSGSNTSSRSIADHDYKSARHLSPRHDARLGRSPRGSVSVSGGDNYSVTSDNDSTSVATHESEAVKRARQRIQARRQQAVGSSSASVPHPPHISNTARRSSSRTRGSHQHADETGSMTSSILWTEPLNTVIEVKPPRAISTPRTMRDLANAKEYQEKMSSEPTHMKPIPSVVSPDHTERVTNKGAISGMSHVQRHERKVEEEKQEILPSMDRSLSSLHHSRRSIVGPPVTTTGRPSHIRQRSSASLGSLGGYSVGDESEADQSVRSMHSSSTMGTHALEERSRRREDLRQSKIAKIVELRDKNQVLKTQIKELGVRLKEKDQTLLDVTTRTSIQIDSLQVQLRDANTGANSLMKLQGQTVNEKDHAVKALSDVAMRLNERMRDKARVFSAKKRELATTKIQLQKTEKRRRISELKLARVTLELKQNEKEILRLQKDLTESMDRAQILQVEKNASLQEIDGLRTRLKESLDKVTWMQEESIIKTDQIERLEDQLLEKDNQIDDLREELHTRLKRIVDIEVELETVTSELIGLEEQHEIDMQDMEKEYQEKLAEVEASAAAAAKQAAVLEEAAAAATAQAAAQATSESSQEAVATQKPEMEIQTDIVQNDVPLSPSSEQFETLSPLRRWNLRRRTERGGLDLSNEDNVRRTIVSHEDTIARLESDLTKMNHRYKEDKFKNSAQIEDLTDENEAYKHKVKVLQTEFVKFNKLITEKGTGDSEANGDNEGSLMLKKQILDLEEQLAHLRKERDMYQTTISGLNKELVQLKFSSKSEAQKTEKELEELRTENEINSSKVTALESEFLQVNNDQHGKREILSPQDQFDRKRLGRLEIALEEKRAEIERLEEANIEREEIADELRLELMNLKVSLKDQTFLSENEIKRLLEENVANAVKVDLLEAHFQQVNTPSKPSDRKGNSGGNNDTNVRLDEKYLKALKVELKQKDAHIKGLGEEIMSNRAVASRVESDLRRELDQLRADRDRMALKVKTSSDSHDDEVDDSRYNNNGSQINMSGSFNHDEDIFFTEDDLKDILQGYNDRPGEFLQ